jgi:hypothetical protein
MNPIKCCEDTCEHTANIRHTDFETVTEYICCHCGYKRTERIENKTRNWKYDYDESDHGPFAPKDYDYMPRLYGCYGIGER